MGSPETERDRKPNEVPQHEVTITTPFYMGKYEVTQEQWDAVMASTLPNPSQFRGPKYPVQRVTWGRSVEFCEKLGRTTGRSVRLPTEAEWEYACRAGTRTAFSFGDAYALTDAYAWFGDNAEQTAHPVGEKKPNPWGLYDMHGNVWEWCQDWHVDRYEAAAAADPQGPLSGTHRVLRGGSWLTGADGCRSAHRDPFNPNFRSANRGFRALMVVASRPP
jgi:formylglycine-generating enzyme required for sulfatase activity